MNRAGMSTDLWQTFPAHLSKKEATYVCYEI